MAHPKMILEKKSGGVERGWNWGRREEGGLGGAAWNVGWEAAGEQGTG